MPELRDGPPFLMTEMIQAEPFVAARIASRVADDPAAEALVQAIREAATHGEPITFTGCGTSDHAAQAAAFLVADALHQHAHLVHARQALDIWRTPQKRGLVIGISHEGGTAATNEAMGASRRAGARTALVTVSRRSPGGAIADLVIETAEQDQSWCHTVGYLSPIVAAASIAASLRDGGLDSTALTALLAAGAARDEAASDVARQLTGCRRLLIAGAAIDLVTARELALKIEEGARLPATAMHLESIRHGHLAAAEGTTGLVFVLTDAEDDGAPLVERTGGTLRAASALGMPSAAILGTRLETAMPEELLSAGQLSAPEANGIWPMAERVIGAAPPMQLLALHLATALGRNPDPIGRDDARQAAAASA
jgi:glucosamine 6-phosphate synthetase-like amidotransferase/phosphosugar isomerase protein